MNYTGFPNGKAETNSQDCASLEKPPLNYEWNDVNCKNYKFCAPCFYEKPTILKLRGICDEDIKASFFILDEIDDNYKYNFR